MKKTGSRAGSYAVALLSVGVGVALPLVTKPFVGQSAPWISFIPAVVLSAWYGGFIPGLMTTLLLVVVTITMEQTLFTSGSPGARLFAGLMFILAALAVCFVIRAMRRAQAAALEAAAAAREAEASAQAQRDRLDVILRDLPVGVVIATEQRKVELANPAAREIHGARLRPGDDLPFCRRAGVQNADGVELDQGDWPIERSLRDNETIVNEEIDIVMPDGSSRALMINSRPLEAGRSGRSTAIATYSDVTSLRAAQKALRGSEARLRRLFESPIIGVVSGEGEIALEANDSFLRTLGFTREDLQNRRIDFSGLTPPEFRAADARAITQLEHRGFTDPIVKELLAADGRSVPVMVGVTSFEVGLASPWIAWVLDLSEHRKLEERLRQAAKAESIGLLAGGVAHDFNNLLTIIIGNATMAKSALAANSAAKHHIDDALRAAERAADLTRQLLAYAGKGRFVVRYADVSATIREIGELFRSSAPKGVEVRLDLAANLPLVRGDVTQIQQLVMNLVINGVESMTDRPGTVRVSTSAKDVDQEFLKSADLVQDFAPGHYVLIEVSDDGCGMDTDTRLRIFDPFFTTKFTGRGLGLAAAGGIVRAHNGGMIVRSTPGQGSTFQVLLPAAAPQKAEPDTGGVEAREELPVA